MAEAGMTRYQKPPEGALYDVAREITDEILGEGGYAEINQGNPDPNVQAAIERGRSNPMYKLSIWYAASAEDAPQTHDLTAEQVLNYVRPEVGFMSDMLNLKGEGVRKLTLEVKS